MDSKKPPFGRDDGEVERHADGQEEQPHQQAAERLDVAFDLVPVARTRQHHPGKESAHRHGQPGDLHQQCRTEDHQQRARRQDLARPRPRQQGEERVQTPARHHQEHRQRGRRHQNAGPSRLAVREGRQKGDHRQKRHDHQILEQEDRDRLLPSALDISPRSCSTDMMTAVEDRTKPAPAMKATGPGKTEHHRARQREGRDRAGDLGKPQPEDLATHGPELGGRSSSPITNRNITTPSSEKCRMDWASVNRPSTDGPTRTPAAK